jgi:hypothetical protein
MAIQMTISVNDDVYAAIKPLIESRDIDSFFDSLIRPYITMRNVAMTAPRPAKQIGLLKGRFTVPEDFDAPLPDDLLEAFGYEETQGGSDAASS